MEEKRVENESRLDLNLEQMEQVYGGNGRVSKLKLIVVACGGCGKHFTITQNTTVHLCECGYKNRFVG